MTRHLGSCFLAFGTRGPLVLGALLLPLVSSSALGQDAPTLQALTRAIGGISVDDPGIPKDCAKRLEHYGHKVGRSWDRYMQRIGTPARAWAEQELPQEPGDTVFYPFSGPDFVTAHRLYPKASRFILVSRQWAKRPPSITAGPTRCLGTLLPRMQDAVALFSVRGFFKTVELNMRESVGGAFDGFTWMLVFFAAREGFDVLDATPMRIRSDGADLEPHPGNPKLDETWASVRFHLRHREDGRDVILDYVSVNLLDTLLDRHPEQRTLLANASRGRVVLKAASHLMQQQKGFTTIRTLLLDNARSIVQDETAIPYQMLQERFQTRLYGGYVSENMAFAAPQPLLEAAYRTRTDIQPLPFKYGYRKEVGSCLMVATPLESRVAGQPRSRP